jgi:hypothetical protein
VTVDVTVTVLVDVDVLTLGVVLVVVVVVVVGSVVVVVVVGGVVVVDSGVAVWVTVSVDGATTAADEVVDDEDVADVVVVVSDVLSLETSEMIAYTTSARITTPTAPRPTRAAGLRYQGVCTGASGSCRVGSLP